MPYQLGHKHKNGQGRIRTYEDFTPTVLQTACFNHLHTYPYDSQGTRTHHYRLERAMSYTYQTKEPHGAKFYPIENFFMLCYNSLECVGTHTYETCSRRRGRKCIMTIQTLYYVVMMSLGVLTYIHTIRKDKKKQYNILAEIFYRNSLNVRKLPIFSVVY